MGYEIDYLPVGTKPDHKSGDAIAMRFWDTDPDKSVVITIDGGTRDSGAALVEHVKKYYKTSTVHIAVLTHPDADHSSGLRDILEQMDVAVLLCFIPWEHASDVLSIVRNADSRVTVASIQNRLRDAFPATVEAVELAREKKIKIIEPFANKSPIDLNEATRAYLLGPTYDAYLNRWLPHYDCLPTLPTTQSRLLEILRRKVERAAKWIAETWDSELLIDPGDKEVNAENNSSVILALVQGNNRFLFCGDAGLPSLTDALTFGSTSGLSPSGYTFFHVPHHGSRHNVGPTLLNAFFGEPLPSPGDHKTGTAFVSATRGDPKHPSRRVTNALNRRDVKVIATAGSAKLHHSSDYVDRGWQRAEPVPFYDQVEDIEDN
ncbi:hypothetical protein ACFL5Z_16470 [Planctomycetota bacterium]